MISFNRVKKALKKIKGKRKIDTDCSVLPRDWNGLKALKHEQLFQDDSKMKSEDFTIYEGLAEV